MPLPDGRASDDETSVVIAAALEVHRVLGNGFHEAVYQDALTIVLEEKRIPFLTEVPFIIQFKGHELRSRYRADLVCFDQIIVELKALNRLGPLEEAQVLNYLKASGLSRALLFNFGQPRLEFRRYVGSAWRDKYAQSGSSVDSVSSVDSPSAADPEV